ncbi:MAG: DNA primase [Bacteroidota bacterium]
MISNDTVQTIIETARIEEVVGDFVNLKRRGANLTGLCPFHNEKTPSFSVSPAKGIYKCFGCGKAGNALRFIMEHERLAYPDALRYLAAKYNIAIEEKEESPEEKQSQNERESLLAVSAFASKYFIESLLNTEQGKAIGLSYFKERGFSQETIEKFQLGFSDDAWDGVTKAALKNGFELPYLEKAGLTIVNGDQRHDRFRNRVIFPIHSLSGRVIGFGGRILGKEVNKAKYVNSPESEIYHKSATLYGIYLARTAIMNKDECYLVEGYTDVISLHQAGFENVVASSGTSLTTDQIKMIKRFTNNITILYDGDEAGIKASFRGIDMILEQGMQVRIVLFPEGNDPDSFVRKNRHADVVKFFKEQTVNFILFKTRLLHEDSKNDPILRTQLIKDIVHSISLIPDAISRNEYTRECGNILNIPELTLSNELNRVLRKSKNQPQGKSSQETQEVPEAVLVPEPQTEFDFSNSEFQEREIIRLLITWGTHEIHIEDADLQKASERVGNFIVHEIIHDELSFTNPLYQGIFDKFAEEQQKGVIQGTDFFTNHPDQEISKLGIDLISSPYSLSDRWMEKKRIFVLTEKEVLTEAVTSAMLSFKLKKLERMILDNQKLMQYPGDQDLTQVLQNQKNLTTLKKMISAKLGIIITR